LDYEQAAAWYRKSAEQGNSDSQNDLGVLYDRGNGMRQDYSQAIAWFRKSADQGNAYGERNLALEYWHGNGVHKDVVEAVKWFRKVAEQGEVGAQNALITIYGEGDKGVPKDQTQALYWQGKIFERFQKQAAAWRATNPKPSLNEEAERQRILAENAIREHDLDSAIQHYEKGLAAQPMWPAGWFNLAMVYAEQSKFNYASDRMKHYLEMVPDAPDAKEAREQMIIWEDKAKR